MTATLTRTLSVFPTPASDGARLVTVRENGRVSRWFVRRVRYSEFQVDDGHGREWTVWVGGGRSQHAAMCRAIMARDLIPVASQAKE